MTKMSDTYESELETEYPEPKRRKIQMIVESLKTENKWKQKCANISNPLVKCIVAKLHLSSNEYGPIFEKYIKNIFSLDKPPDKTSGDGCINGMNIEIKVSLGDNSGKFNIVQIRPDHSVHYYIIFAYNIHERKYGKVYWFLIPVPEIYDIVIEYGDYAHGTKEKCGQITKDNMFGRNFEYAIRPNPNSSENTKQRKLWNALLQYSTNEQAIKLKLQIPRK